MKIRKGPGTHNEVVAYVPSKDYVLVCDELSTPAEFEGKKGNWRRVRYKSRYGYLFDGFVAKAKSNLILNIETWEIAIMPDVQHILDSAATENASADSLMQTETITPGDSNLVQKADAASVADTLELPKDTATLVAPNAQDSAVTVDVVIVEEPQVVPPLAEYIFAVETYNYCGDIAHLDPGIRWYGIYYDDNNKAYKNTRIELEVMRSKYALGSGLEFDIKSEARVTPHFMLGTKSKLDTSIEIAFDHHFFNTHPQSLYPGQSINIYSSEPVNDIFNFTLFATGNVTDVSLCPVMEDYKMKLTGEMNDSLVVQELNSDIPYFGKCGMPSIYWFGDFNKDLYPDFILASQSKEQTTFVLFVSDTRTNGKLVRKAGEWSYSKCD